MAYLALGINHKTAPIALREQVAFAPAQLPAALHAARQALSTQEVAILSTCNRTELYCAESADTPLQPERLLHWLTRYHDVAPQQLAGRTYVYRALDAVQHIMRVACGLDSMVLGEPQILGQLKGAYATAKAAGTVSTLLSRLFQYSFTTAKQVRTQTAIGKEPVSVAYAATRLAKQIFANLSTNTALLIGAGDTVERVIQHLRQQGLNRILVANRTLARAVHLASQYHGQAVRFAELPAMLPQADIVITSTASSTPVLYKKTVAQSLSMRKHRPLLMIDVAVPRDIEPTVSELADVFLYTVDDLDAVIQDTVRQRQAAAVQAEDLIQADALAFVAKIQSLDATGLLCRYREQIEQYRDQAVQRATQALHNGMPPEAALRMLAHTLTNKVMHSPSTQLKQAAALGQQQRLQWAKVLLGLEEHKT